MSAIQATNEQLRIYQQTEGRKNKPNLSFRTIGTGLRSEQFQLQKMTGISHLFINTNTVWEAHWSGTAVNLGES